MRITWNGDWFYHPTKSHASIDRELVLALHRLGHEINVNQIRDSKNYNDKLEDHRLIKRFSENSFKADFNVYKYPTIKYAEKGKYNALLHNDGAYTSTVREKQLIEDSYITHLWLPTSKQSSIIDKQLSVKVVSPGIDAGINPKEFHPNILSFDYCSENASITSDTFKFILACDSVHSTKSRPNGGFRGSDIAIKAFMSEFTSKDDVCLIIKATRNSGTLEKYVRRFENDNSPLIIRDYETDPRSVMAKKWKGVDCLLSPIRDCRWEACCLEALAVGTPAIATNIGGPRRYGRHGIFFVDHLSNPGDLCHFRGDIPLGDDLWTEPPVENFGRTMRQVYEMDKAELKDFGLRGATHVAKNWCWSNIAKRMVATYEGRDEELSEDL